MTPTRIWATASSASAISGGDSREHVRLHARQSRFRIKSKSDTAVGQVRTLIEGDFEGAGGNELFSNSTSFRLRHAWGEWDITPNTTIGIGQTWSNFMNLFAYPDTVDFFGPAGASFARQGQVRLTYTSGPILFAIAVENPETDSSVQHAGHFAPANMTTVAALASVAVNQPASTVVKPTTTIPDFTARLQYDAPGGHKFQVSGVLRNLRVDGDVARLASPAVTRACWGVSGCGIDQSGRHRNLHRNGWLRRRYWPLPDQRRLLVPVLTGTLANPNIRPLKPGASLQPWLLVSPIRRP